MKILDSDIKAILSDHNIPWGMLDHSTILVTGATGLIGSLIIRTLLYYGHNIKIYALVRDQEKARALLGDSIHYVRGDIRYPLHVEGQIEYVIHCAAVTTSKYMYSNPVETLEISIWGTKNILDFSRNKGIKSVLYVSSMEVYGKTTAEDNPITEKKMGYVDLADPRSSYPEGKRVCELLGCSYFREFGIPVKIVRLAQTFGAGVSTHDNRAPIQFARCVLDDRDIVLHTHGHTMSNFCYTADAIRAILTVLLKGKNGEAYNVCYDAESRTILEIAKLVANQVSQGRIKVQFDIPKENVFGYAAETNTRLCSQKLEELGWFPRIGMKEAYTRLLQYLMETV